MGAAKVEPVEAEKKALLTFDLPLRPAMHTTTSTVAQDPASSALEAHQQQLDVSMLDAEPPPAILDDQSAEPFALDPSLLPPTPPPDWEDILGTDFSDGFDLSQDMWQYS
ncbi:hypothetical protein LTR56_022118 [Elasticomyces elasticus]|nr:hypothetical protein LTR56_022118 [Elasticomyces elasticus]KAK3642008.1 hypothetical protein LTR22_016333 [Elasticomyces elasticus]KAK4910641.1 hypothetical protein LTR49_020676 [Elasticomyces elasticus]KAK5748852.1 hypothetical protein LTS12_021090 [Elasticomyces elasticus]